MYPVKEGTYPFDGHLVAPGSGLCWEGKRRRRSRNVDVVVVVGGEKEKKRKDKKRPSIYARGEASLARADCGRGGQAGWNAGLGLIWRTPAKWLGQSDRQD